MSRGDIPTIEGALDARGLRVVVVVARFNAFVTEKLLEGAIDALVRHGAKHEDLAVVRVAGAWELPQAVESALASGGWDAAVALGCLMRGDTIHFDLIAAQCAKGLASIALASGAAIGFGVLTVDTLEQAIARAGGKHGNKGVEAALAALEQARVLAAIGSGRAKALRGSKPRRGS
jgi:6,7-dimethyl-8-ribityllumazine synthase